MAQRLKGRDVANALQEKIRTQVGQLSEQGIFPTLAILRVGDREDDVAYERSAGKCCGKLGIEVKHYTLPAEATQEELMETIRNLNTDPAVHGVLMLRPLPSHLDEDTACRALDHEKDVDGITDGSLTGVFTGQKLGFPPCTPQGCMEMLEYYGIPCDGKRAVVIGRSLVVGKPAAMMLTDRNATVTICHSRTKDLAAICREADILIVAAGRRGVVGSDAFAPGQTVLDVGIHFTQDGHMCGDVNYEEAEPVVAAISPVPGGVGTVTTSVLAGHVVEAAARQNGIEL